ncbi:MAG: S4 domain-containing protein [Clostridia bacterium]|nr:S4 domain-containing protein [Clostridia bacterium]
MNSIEVGKNEQQQRLDKFLKKYLGNAPLSYIYKAIRKDVKVNGKRAKEDTILQLGDTVTLYISDADLAKFTKKRERTRVKRQFKIAYEDENILVAEKPFGLLTHGDRTEKKNHLANQVVDYLIEK